MRARCHLAAALVAGIAGCARVYSVRLGAGAEKVGTAPTSYTIDLEVSVHGSVGGRHHVELAGDLGVVPRTEPQVRAGFAVGWLWAPRSLTTVLGAGYAAQRTLDGDNAYDAAVLRATAMVPVFRRGGRRDAGLLDELAAQAAVPTLDPVGSLQDGYGNDGAPTGRSQPPPAKDVEYRLSLGVDARLGVVAAGDRERGSALRRVGLVLSWDVVDTRAR